MKLTKILGVLAVAGLAATASAQNRGTNMNGLMGSGFNRTSPDRVLWSATNGGYPAGSDAAYAAYRSNAQLETDDFIFRLRGSAVAP